MVVSSNITIEPVNERKLSRRMRNARRQRGLSLPMALMFVALFGTLTGSMMLFSQSTLQTAHGHEKLIQARAAAESGLAFGIAQLNMMAKPKTAYGTLDPAIYPTLAKSLFQTGVAPNFAAQFDGKTILRGKTCAVTTTSVTVPPIKAFGTLENSQFKLILTQDPANSQILRLTSIGNHQDQLAGVSVDILMEKKIKYAVYSNVAIQLGKNAIVDGDIISKLTGFSKGAPIQSLSDFRAIKAGLDTDLATLRTFLKARDKTSANRVAMSSLTEAQIVDAFNKGLLTRQAIPNTNRYTYSDYSSDGYIDDYDMFIKHCDPDFSSYFGESKIVTAGEFIDPNSSTTPKSQYDPELFYLLDHLKPPLNPFDAKAVKRDGFADGFINDDDPYAKVRGTVQFSVTKAAFDSWAATSGSNYGGTNFVDIFQGPVQSSDPTVPPVEFGVADYKTPSLTPADFDTTTFRTLAGPATGRTTVVNATNNGLVQNALVDTTTVKPNGWVLTNPNNSGSTTYPLEANETTGAVYYPGTTKVVLQKNGQPIMAKQTTAVRTVDRYGKIWYQIKNTSLSLPANSSGELLNPKTNEVVRDINGASVKSATEITLPVNAANKVCLPDTGTVVVNGSGSSYTATTTTAITSAPLPAVQEEIPFGSSSYRATYLRPVYSGITFDNCIIPEGTNALFVGCTFTGVTYVDVNTSLTTSTSAKMLDGTSFNKDKTLTKTNSYGYNEGNNLRFESCKFNGPLFASNPSQYTDYTNSWEFTGDTRFELPEKYSIPGNAESGATIEAPNTNIEMGSFSSPTSAPSTLRGVVVAGNIDIRGSSIVDGSVIVTGTGASNTTLGYFGKDDNSTSISQMPEGGYGRLYLRYNPLLALPYGINIPIVLTAKRDSYRVLTRASDGVNWP